MNVDALTSWLQANPSAAEEAPDWVALAQTLARLLEECEKPADVAVVTAQYRMVLKELHGLGGGDDGDELGVAMRATVRNPPDGGS